jgi:inner membrane protein
LSPITHFLVSWGVANLLPHSTKRDRAIITFAGVVPDLDGLGIVPEMLTRHTSSPLLWWTNYHHVPGHNIAGALVVVAVAALLAHSKWKTALLAAVTFHLHLFCDGIGSRGPDGYQWPIPYLLPFSNAVNWAWSGQWALNAWQNMVITVVMLAVTIALARVRGYSPLEMLSSKWDHAFVEAIRNRFPLRA